MPRRRARKGLLTAAAALSAAALLSAAPASADCVSAEVAYKQPSQTKQYVVGPKFCAVATPWGEWQTVFVPPTGYPPVVTVEGRVWVPAP